MRRLALAATIAALAAIATAAQAEPVQEGNLRVSFEGNIVPHSLPRATLAPITVHLDSSIGTVDGTRPPQLRKVSIAVNRAGHVSFGGLPTCTRGELEQTNTAAALALCKPALVGHGTFDARVEFASGPPIPVNGRVLVFNSKIAGKTSLLLHIYNSTPVRLAFVLPFTIERRASGDFGTAFTARIPRIASDRGYVTGLQLTLKRKYAFRGERRSVFSASCAAAPGFPGAIFTLARATFYFENSKQLTSALTRDCTVRQSPG
jgi:hypothetical protein